MFRFGLTRAEEKRLTRLVTPGQTENKAEDIETPNDEDVSLCGKDPIAGELVPAAGPCALQDNDHKIGEFCDDRGSLAGCGGDRESSDTSEQERAPDGPLALCCRGTLPGDLPAEMVRDCAGGVGRDLDLGGEFVPMEPRSLEEAKLTESEVEALILKFLLARGEASGRQIADQVKLPFILVERLLRGMKNDQLVAHRGAAPMNDYVFQLTEMGRERARRLAAHCSYFGAAPVALSDYVASVRAQTLSRQVPTRRALEAAFADLIIDKSLLDRLGPAVCSGKGLFLYGSPGNGKTSIAERVCRAFGPMIWIPRAIGVDGEIIRLFDPLNHEEIPLEEPPGLYDGRAIDRRWVRIRRPTIVAGGELTMSALEVTVNTSSGICEAPLQLKANCGVLVIDDFGRQRVSVTDLLNRWIVPLEKRYDFISLPNGRKITVPFDELIIFATNLEPRDLVDEAFLRRIPYKVEIPDPTEEQFRKLFALTARQLGLALEEEVIEYLLEKHYRAVGRPLRFCHPRDLLLQVRNYCVYHELPLEVRPEYLDLAVATYFAVL